MYLELKQRMNTRRTFTRQVSLRPLLVFVSVIVASPSLLWLAQTYPLLVTVATLTLLLVHVTDLLVALLGKMLAVSCLPPLNGNGSELHPLIHTLVTGMSTGTLQVAVTALVPSCTVAVMVAVPATPPCETRPVVAFTAATLVLLLVHLTVLFVALAGKTVAESCLVLPGVNTTVEHPEIVTLLTGTLTFTAQVAV